MKALGSPEAHVSGRVRRPVVRRHAARPRATAGLTLTTPAGSLLLLRSCPGKEGQ